MAVHPKRSIEQLTLPLVEPAARAGLDRSRELSVSGPGAALGTVPVSIVPVRTDPATAASRHSEGASKGADRAEKIQHGHHDRPTLLSRLRALSHGRIARVTLTRNRSTILSAKPLDGDQSELKAPTSSGHQFHVRIHRCFVGANDEILQAAADFTAKRLSRHARQAALAVLRSHFDAKTRAESEMDRVSRAPRRIQRPRGRHWDLKPMFEELNQDYFGGALDLVVGWGDSLRNRRRRRRTVQLGSFDDETRSIRLHPILDRPEVPRYVVAAVLHHEMVHAVVPAQRSSCGTHRRVHTPEFRRLERAFEHYQQAERWIALHLFPLMGRVERDLAKTRD